MNIKDRMKHKKKTIKVRKTWAICPVTKIVPNKIKSTKTRKKIKVWEID